MNIDISLFLARFFGVLLTIVYASLFFYQARYQHFLKDLQDQPATFFLTGFLSLMIGILTILLHNVWIPDWRGLLTFIGWLIFISGVLRIFFPKQILNAASYLLESKHYYILYAIATLMELAGLYLLYIGFIKYGYTL